MGKPEFVKNLETGNIAQPLSDSALMLAEGGKSSVDVSNEYKATDSCPRRKEEGPHVLHFKGMQNDYYVYECTYCHLRFESYVYL